MLWLGVWISKTPETSKIATPPTRKRRFPLSGCSKPQAWRLVGSHPPCRCRVFGFPGGPKIAQDAEKTDFLRLRFLVEISIPRRDPQNRRFWRPGRVPGCPGVPFWSHFWCFLGSLRSCFSRRFFAPFFGRFFVDFCNSSVAASILGVLPHRPRTLYFTYDSAHPHFAADLALQDFPA